MERREWREENGEKRMEKRGGREEDGYKCLQFKLLVLELKHILQYAYIKLNIEN